jgi:ribonuclease HI
MTGKKLPHYFECHSIIVVASNPVSSILNNPDATGRVSLWGITLGPWEITYHRQSAIKSQVLPDFIAKWTEAQMPELPDLSNTWTIFLDGSKRVLGAGAGVVLVSPQGDRMRYVLRMRFSNPSNNEVEYETVLHGMRMAKACGATRIKIHGDSNLIAQQVMKECNATCANMIAYHAMYDKLEGNFEGCEVTHIGRESNEEADNLANIGSKCLPIPPGVFFEEIFERSVKIKPVINPALATRSGAQQGSTTPAAGTEDPPPPQRRGHGHARQSYLDEAIPGLPDKGRTPRRPHPSPTSYAALQGLPDNQRGALQAQHHRGTPTMHSARRWNCSPTRNP